MEVISDFFQEEKKLASTRSEFFDSQFYNHPIPVCILSDCFDMISQNLAFSKINITPGECHKLKDLDKFEKKGELYYVRLKEIEYENQKYTMYIFQGIDHFTEALSKKEQDIYFISENNDLEIVTSSMAHELNNPIAGILGAAELLELEFEDLSLDETLLQDLSEIKKSAKRCRDLIEIFLGFSRGEDDCRKKYCDKDLELVLKESASKSVDLLHPRMLESNILINLDIQNDSKDRETIVLPHAQMGAFTLFFYTLLNEAIVSISHQRLVMQIPLENKQLLDWQLKFERKNQGPHDTILLSFFYQTSLSDFERLCNSKLFQYLLKKINISFDKKLNEMSKSEHKLVFIMKI